MPVNNLRHGMCYTRIHKIWCGIKQRCRNPNDPSYKWYGARGIDVCERWHDSFDAFFEDMGDEYADDLQIDRIDPDGDYERSNCRWVSCKENQRNRRNNRIVNWGGKDITLTEAGEVSGIGEASLRYRLSAGWTLEQAMTLPKRPGIRPPEILEASSER